MLKNFLQKIDRLQLFSGAFVLIATLLIYVKTMAPTLSFWDCGEFIACSYILGIPHPPGTPLYILIGRIFSIIPLFDDISVRLNFLSALSSAFTALFCYLCAVRILAYWFDNKADFTNKLIIHAGSVSGALIAAFGLTNWNNSVETEVYGLSMMLFMGILWLTLLYLDKRDEPGSIRLVALIFYLAFLGIGIHMTTFLVLPIVSLAFVLKKNTPVKVWYAVGGFIFFELYLIFILSSRPTEIPLYVPVLIVSLIFLFFVFSFDKLKGIYLIALAGFMLSVAPLFGKLYESMMISAGASGNLSPSAASVLDTVGGVSFAALIAFGIYALIKRISLRKSGVDSDHYFNVALFIIVVAIMSVFVFLDAIKGHRSFLALSAVMAIVLVLLIYRYINWSMLIATAGAMLIVLGVTQYFYGTMAVLAILTLGGLIFKLSGWKNAILIILVAAIGFSCHLFIPIRSSLNPAINENNPSSSLQATINYLERKQYGSQSMVERMFKRRGDWQNQFGDFRRMGFWKAFKEQFGFPGPFFIIPLLLGLFGFWEVIRKKPARGVILFSLLLIGSAGLVLYMNFADGTRIDPQTGADYLEVRNRDYFFTPAFVIFGMAIGLGIATTVYYIRDAVSALAPVIRKTAVTAASLLFFLPVVTIAGNYHYADRTDNYLPYDYAYNLLTSADENAIFFTSGDNDTFPLWCLQQVYNVRTDVKNVNLSLSNTRWYIKQLKSNLGVTFSLTDEEIDQMRPFRTRDGTVFKLQDQVIDIIMKENFGRTPINFSVTVGSSARKYKGRSLDSLLSLKGMAWRVNDTVRNLGVDIEESYELFTNPDKFQYRHLNDPDVYYNETSTRIAKNLANGFLVLGDALRVQKDFERSESLVLRARQLIPSAKAPLKFLSRLYFDQRKDKELKALIDTVNLDDKTYMYVLLAQTYSAIGDNVRAEATLKSRLSQEPSNRILFDELMRIYLRERRLNAMRAEIRKWLQLNPHDEQVREIYRDLERVINSGDSFREATR
ncbi:MAG: DUF2723 domain-containing protein [candidate division Zixibacteria bacterium]|nr:DUF2723 domain-containing protein [candidate division Zixibacteria bacterium]